MSLPLSSPTGPHGPAPSGGASSHAECGAPPATSEATVIAFVLDIGLHAAEAHKPYTLLKSFNQCAITQLASFNVCPDKLQRSALANHIQQQIAKLSSQ